MRTFLEVGLKQRRRGHAAGGYRVVVGRLSRQRVVTHALWLLVLVKLVTPPLVRVPLAWPTSDAPVAVVSTPVALAAGGDASRHRLSIAPCCSHRSSFSNKLPDVSAGEKSAFDPWAALVVLWLAGSLLWFAWTGVYLVRFRRLLRHAAARAQRLASAG